MIERFAILLYLGSISLAADMCGNISVHPGLDYDTTNIYSVEPEAILRGPLFQVGDFLGCIYTRKQQYCMTQLIISSDNLSSPFWHWIQEINTVSTHFHRDKLYIGVCVSRQCSTQQVSQGFESTLADTANRLGVYANITVEPNACQTEDRLPIEIIDYATLGVLLVILLLVLCSTTYEGVRRMYNQRDPPETRGGRLLLCFALQINFKRLESVKCSEDTKDFRVIQGIRTISMFFVVTGHLVFTGILTPVKNPEWLEESYYDFLKISFFNGPTIMATFFCISGFLLGAMFFKQMEEHKEFKWSRFFIVLFHRYVRLTPVYIVMILLQASWFNHLGKGPMWSTVISSEVEYCRHNWWLNLLYINNYVKVEEMCLEHTWYLASDFQCYIVCMLILIYVWKHPHHAKTIFGSALLVWIIVPFVQTYMERLDPTLLAYPENIRKLSAYKTFRKQYITFHNNCSAYLIGTIFGYAYYKIKQAGEKRVQMGYWLMWGIGLTLPWFFLIVAFIFYQPSYKYDVLVASFYACINKTLFSAGIGTIILGCALGYGWIANYISAWKPFVVLGRLTYTTYLIHPSLMRMHNAAQKEPIFISYLWIIQTAFADFIISNIFAALLCLFVEMPTSALNKVVFNPNKQREGKDKKTLKNNNITTIEDAYSQGSINTIDTVDSHIIIASRL